MASSSSVEPFSANGNHDHKAQPRDCEDEILGPEDDDMKRKLVRKIDIRLCTIAGILCSLNLLDSGIISSASVTSIFEDLELGVGNRYVSAHTGGYGEVEVLGNRKIMFANYLGVECFDFGVYGC